MPVSSASRPTFTINGHALTAATLKPGLYIVATPIGNLADITLRALETLSAADVILCEDTRVSSRLLQRYEIKTTLKPYHDHNAAKQRPAIMAMLQQGKAVALISDAGTPLISDPGYKLVNACRDHDIALDVIPGPSAPLAALTLSGLPSDQFRFCGFLPPRQQARVRLLQSLSDADATLIFFESPHRLQNALADIASAMPGREVAVCRELTKLHQETIRGPVETVLDRLSRRSAIKGEITLLVAPATQDAHTAGDAAVAEALRHALHDLPVAKAAGRVAKEFGLKKAEVYALALSMKDEKT
jgi:16S rRNA (cytidine1402-2'-O)-methyltransferase